MVSIDTVYQRILTICNKEQRGYITPQEFNLLANQAQMAIFEQYFSEVDNYRSYKGNDTTYADPLTMVEEKLQIFEDNDDNTIVSNYATVGTSTTDIILPNYIYRIDHLITGGIETERLSTKDYSRAFYQPLTNPNLSRPIYYVRENVLRINDGADVDPSTKEVNIFYIRKPADANWGYIITQGEAMYNPSAQDAQDFELHASEETLLVIKILELAGVVLNKPGLTQIAGNEEVEMITQQKIKQ